jgi:hypothetical protein
MSSSARSAARPASQVSPSIWPFQSPTHSPRFITCAQRDSLSLPCVEMRRSCPCHHHHCLSLTFLVCAVDKQPSWEGGLICYEIVMVAYPFDNYPLAGLDQRSYRAVDRNALARNGTTQLAQAVGSLLEWEPAPRSTLDAALLALN